MQLAYDYLWTVTSYLLTYYLHVFPNSAYVGIIKVLCFNVISMHVCLNDIPTCQADLLEENHKNTNVKFTFIS